MESLEETWIWIELNHVGSVWETRWCCVLVCSYMVKFFKHNHCQVCRKIPPLSLFPLWTTYHCKAPQMPELLYENLPMHFPWWVATTVYSTSKCQRRSQHFLLEGSKFSRSLLSTNTIHQLGNKRPPYIIGATQCMIQINIKIKLSTIRVHCNLHHERYTRCITIELAGVEHD